MTDDVYEEGSAVEAAEAAGHHHHPQDPNAGLVRGRAGRGATLAAVLSALLTTAAVVLLALAIGSNG